MRINLRSEFALNGNFFKDYAQYYQLYGFLEIFQENATKLFFCKVGEDDACYSSLLISMICYYIFKDLI